jgi:hypothetical protein
MPGTGRIYGGRPGVARWAALSYKYLRKRLMVGRAACTRMSSFPTPSIQLPIMLFAHPWKRSAGALALATAALLCACGSEVRNPVTGRTERTVICPGATST